MDLEKLKPIVEALIFAGDEPVPVKQITSIIEEAGEKEILKAIESLNLEYNQTNRTMMIIKIAGGYQMVTRDKYAPFIRKLFQRRIKSRLSQAALEVLSVIAFKQPVSRVDIDAIRGVNSDGVIRTLLERRLITMCGRADGPGRPLLYKTTKDFLKHFGINSLSDLPKPKELEEFFKEEDLSSEDKALIQGKDKMKEDQNTNNKTSGQEEKEIKKEVREKDQAINNK